jgi:hypothetical protein
MSSARRRQLISCVKILAIKPLRRAFLFTGDLERAFSLQQEAIIAAIQLANESGKNGKPSV